MKGCLSGCRKFFTWPVLFICGGLFVLSSLFPSETTQVRRTQTAEASLPTVASLAAVGENLTATAVEVADLATEAPTEAPTATITPTEAPSATITPTEVVVQQQAAALPTLAPREDTPVPPAAAQVQPATTVYQRYIRAEDYGEDWPFTVPDGIIECYLPNRIIFRHANRVYAINGRARDQVAEMGWQDLEVIWRDHPDPMLSKVVVRDVLNLGLSLCEAEETIPEPTLPPVIVPTMIPTLAPTAVPAAAVQQMRPENYHTTGGANIRSCPETQCAAITQLAGNTGVLVTGQIEGEVVSAGNGLWYRIDHNGQEAYIYSGVVRRGAPPAAVQQPPAQQPPVNTGPSQSFPVAPPPVSSGHVWNCSGDIYNCSDFSDRATLMDYWNACPGDPSRLDGGVKNDIPCESLR